MAGYHHGDLRRALVDAALLIVAEEGPGRMSLREVARRAGVSHAAPAHHFRDKAGLLTSIAAEGWRLLGDVLEQAPDFAAQGVTYVLFATEHPAHFAVMRAPDLLRTDDPELTAAQDRAGAQLHSCASGGRALAAWAMVHGLASLLLDRLVTPGPDADVAALAETVISWLAPA